MIVVRPIVNKVIVRAPGPAGPPGPASAFYIHEQTVASATWTIAHNLGFKPSVELFGAGSQEIEGDIVHASANITTVYFTIPITGFARLT